MGTQPLPKRGGAPPNFRPTSFVAKRLHGSLGTEVGLDLCDIVFDVDPATPRKKAHPPQPIFGPCLLWPNGWMDEDAAWYGSRPGPIHIVLDGGSAPAKGTQQPASFRPMSIVATVAHISYCWAVVCFNVRAYPLFNVGSACFHDYIIFKDVIAQYRTQRELKLCRL